MDLGAELGTIFSGVDLGAAFSGANLPDMAGPNACLRRSTIMSVVEPCPSRLEGVVLAWYTVRVLAHE